MKDLIKNYIQLPAKDGYGAAKNQLYQLYGDPYRVIADYQKEIKTLATHQAWGCWRFREDTSNKWSRKVLEIRRKLKWDPELADLIDFVSDENLIVNDPVFSKEAVEHYADDSTLYTYNKNLETVICNLRQEFCII